MLKDQVEQLASLIKSHPNLRIGQLLTNAVFEHLKWTDPKYKTSGPTSDEVERFLFYTQNDDLINILKKYNKGCLKG